ncbi:diguanylate cyclase [Kolteria novifilia]
MPENDSNKPGSPNDRSAAPRFDALPGSDVLWAIPPGESRGRILVVDDSRVIRKLVDTCLRANGFDTVSAENGTEALQKASDVQPDVILLDIDMPSMSGFEVCRQLKGSPDTSLIPIIFLTARDDTENVVRGLELGAFDYVRKPFNSLELCARVGVARRLKYLVDLLSERAMLDGLTGIHNRTYLDRRLRESLDRQRRYDSHAALVLADVDHFKQVNDTRGHVIGDEVLRRIASTLRRTARESDTVARYGGEEFAILLPEQTLSSGYLFAERLRQEIEQMTITHRGTTFSVTVSLGVVTTQETDPKGIDDLLACADEALYHAKKNGRNRVCLWNGHEAVQAEATG